MQDKIYRILDLALELNEQGATRTSCHIAAHVNEISVMVWEGEPKETNYLMYERAYYAGELREEKKVNDIIRELEELRDNI